MTATSNREQMEADMLLTETVAVPVFARKLAADYGLNIDQTNHVDLRVLSDVVHRTVHGVMAKQAAATKQAQGNIAKAAVDAAFAVGGMRPPSAAVQPDYSNEISEFFKIAGVSDAAALLTGGAPQATKVAEDHCPPGTPASTEIPDLEDDKKKDKAPVVAA